MPLVASVIGRTLRDDWGEDNWLSFENEFDACGPRVENNVVLCVLNLSFDRLPRSALKQCFVYCSIFFVMEMKMSIQLWMAQGFL